MRDPGLNTAEQNDPQHHQTQQHLALCKLHCDFPSAPLRLPAQIITGQSGLSIGARPGRWRIIEKIPIPPAAKGETDEKQRSYPIPGLNNHHPRRLHARAYSRTHGSSSAECYTNTRSNSGCCDGADALVAHSHFEWRGVFADGGKTPCDGSCDIANGRGV